MQQRHIPIMHFLEAARFPKAPVLAGCKVNFTLRPAKSADTYFTPSKSLLCQLTVRLTASPPPPHSVWALKQPLSLSYLILSYLILTARGI